MADRSTRSRGRSRQNNQSVPGTDGVQEQLGDILARLHALEGSAPVIPSPSNGATSHVEPASNNVDAACSLEIAAPGCSSQTPSLPPGSSASTIGDPNASSTAVPDATDRLIGALTALTKMTGKLDSGMRGPYRVTRVLPHSRYNLRLVGGSYGKTTQAAAEHMVVWRGEWTPESCAAFFDSEEATAPHTTSTDSNTEVVGPPADDSQPGPPPPTSAGPPQPNAPESHAVARTSHCLPSASHTTDSPTDSDNNDVQDAEAPRPRQPCGRGRPRVRRGRKRR